MSTFCAGAPFLGLLPRRGTYCRYRREAGSRSACQTSPREHSCPSNRRIHHRCDRPFRLRKHSKRCQFARRRRSTPAVYARDFPHRRCERRHWATFASNRTRRCSRKSSFRLRRNPHTTLTKLALGASTGSVLRLVLGQGLALVGLGLALGLAAAIAGTRLITTMLFRMQPNDPVVYLAVAVLLGMVALVASYIPARGASRIDPLTAIRQE